MLKDALLLSAWLAVAAIFAANSAECFHVYASAAASILLTAVSISNQPAAQRACLPAWFPLNRTFFRLTSVLLRCH